MKLILQRLVQAPDKSFIVYHEKEPFFSSPWHYHPEYELVLITKSTGKRIIGDHIGYFEEGDLVFIGSQLPHVYDNDPLYMTGVPGLNAEAIVIQFLPEFLGNVLSQAPELESFRHFLEKSSKGLQISGTTRARVASLMVAMVEMDGLQRLISLLSIFDQLANTIDYAPLASPGFLNNFDVSASDRVRKVTEYMMNNFTRDIPLTRIAEVASMTPTNFCTFFRKYYRETFVSYLNNIRVGYACKLLAQKDMNISEIGYRSGFKNTSNFNRQFKKLKKVTPAEYRQSLSVKFQGTEHLQSLRYAEGPTG